jgi:hypothetical protein
MAILVCCFTGFPILILMVLKTTHIYTFYLKETQYKGYWDTTAYITRNVLFIDAA